MPTNTINTNPLFSPNATCSSGASIYSNPINFNELKLNGFFGLQIKTGGAGTSTFTIECCNDKDYKETTLPDALGFTAPESNSQIATGVTAGTKFYTPTELKIPPCVWFRLKLTAAAADVSGIYAKLAMV